MAGEEKRRVPTMPVPPVMMAAASAASGTAAPSSKDAFRFVPDVLRVARADAGSL
jgi:hypothetical protein